MALRLKGEFNVKTQLDGILTTKTRLDGLYGQFQKVETGDVYTGEYVVTPKAFEEQTLLTEHKLMADNVTVLEIPYYETSNEKGTTVYIGGTI